MSVRISIDDGFVEYQYDLGVGIGMAYSISDVAKLIGKALGAKMGRGKIRPRCSVREKPARRKS